MFKVVPDQLKISDGWVRCGHCSDVFDAMLNLLSEADATKPAPPVGAVKAPSPAGFTSRVVVRTTPPASAEVTSSVAPIRSSHVTMPVVPPTSAASPASAIKPSIDPGWNILEGPGDEADGEPWLEPEEPASEDDGWDGEWLLSPDSMARHRDAVAQELQAASVRPMPPAGPPADPVFQAELSQWATAARVDAPAEVLPGAEPVSAPLPSSLPPMVAEDSGFGPAPEEPSFVVQARREAFWRRPAMRAVLWSAAAVLGVGLLLQWGLFDRDELAARHPGLTPLLQSLCRATGCELSAPRRIDAVAIDSSRLVRKQGQAHTFDLVVKNSEAIEVSMPALELSLTDAADKDIARRVFLPQEMPGSPKVVPAQGSLTVHMQLALSEADLASMAGYRALVFYP